MLQVMDAWGGGVGDMSDDEPLTFGNATMQQSAKYE